MLILWLYDVIKGTLNSGNACCYFVQNRLSSHFLLTYKDYILCRIHFWLFYYVDVNLIRGRTEAEGVRE
jgi:nitrite reductase/ring-hydroxylating ferredoxin subunit